MGEPLEKKVTLRLHLNRKKEQMVYQYILQRDPKRFRTITDYLCAAVLTYEKQKNGKEDDWIQTLIEALEANGYLKPGNEQELKEKRLVEPEI